MKLALRQTLLLAILVSSLAGTARPQAQTTHNATLTARTIELAESQGVTKSSFEFQMLYGIQRETQKRLAQDGYSVSVLISYGTYWFPWYMRRLAERPANVWFVMRNMIG